jgi:phage shock protein A
MNDTGMAIQRARDKTEELQARASAIDELTASGALEDFTAGDQTQLDRELAQISSSGQVDDELAKLKAEVGSGQPQKEIPAGAAEPAPGAAGEQPAAPAEPAPEPAEEATES